jgi:phosphatidate phosphatase PAH1
VDAVVRQCCGTLKNTFHHFPFVSFTPIYSDEFLTIEEGFQYLKMSAVDIIAVRQDDGTIKSTCFHVLFNSKRSSEMVRISVNGTPIPSCTMVAHHESGQVVFSPEVTRKSHRIVRDEKSKKLSLVALDESVVGTELRELPRKENSMEGPIPKCVNSLQDSSKKIKKNGSWNSFLNGLKKKDSTSSPAFSPSLNRNMDQDGEAMVLSNSPTSVQLEQMNLKEGINEIKFTSAISNQVATARLYLWNSDTKIIVSDVDGTITKTDKRGLFYHKLGYDWTHASVVDLYKLLGQSGYQFVYITARSVKTGESTRAFLNKIGSPSGPIFTAPHDYLGCVTTELWKLTSQVKMAHLNSLRKLYPETMNPFVAGFGNASHDEFCYKEAKISSDHIYIINRASEVTVNNMKTSYLTMIAAVHSLFPRLSPSRQTEGDNEETQEENLQEKLNFE